VTGQPPSFEPASLLRRLAAFSYDVLVLAALILSFTLLVIVLRLGEPVPPGSVWFPLCLAALIATFFCGFWVHGGQTLGMRAWRIRVVCDDGGRLRWCSAAARFAAALVAMVPAGFGLWWSLRDHAGRAWHDRWTRTRVVRTDATGTPIRRV
jgi:uncharacterized RDD family membrane protein YckC